MVVTKGSIWSSSGHACSFLPARMCRLHLHSGRALGALLSRSSLGVERVGREGRGLQCLGPLPAVHHSWAAWLACQVRVIRMSRYAKFVCNGLPSCPAFDVLPRGTCAQALARACLLCCLSVSVGLACVCACVLVYVWDRERERERKRKRKREKGIERERERVKERERKREIERKEDKDREILIKYYLSYLPEWQ